MECWLWGVLYILTIEVCATVQGMAYRPSSLEQGVQITEIFV